MTKEIQKQGDYGVACSRQLGVGTLQGTPAENGISQREIPSHGPFRVTEGNHFSRNGKSSTKALGVRPLVSAEEIEPFTESGHPRCPGHPVEAEAISLQPPVIGATLRESVNRLVREASATASMPPSKNDISAPIVDGYVEQIIRWTQRLTPAQLGRSFSLEELMALAGLKGRYREHASLRYTGEALRRCGFKQQRDWTTAGRNKRYWQFVGEEK